MTWQLIVSVSSNDVMRRYTARIVEICLDREFPCKVQLFFKLLRSSSIHWEHLPSTILIPWFHAAWLRHPTASHRSICSEACETEGIALPESQEAPLLLRAMRSRLRQARLQDSFSWVQWWRWKTMEKLREKCCWMSLSEEFTTQVQFQEFSTGDKFEWWSALLKWFRFLFEEWDFDPFSDWKPTWRPCDWAQYGTMIVYKAAYESCSGRCRRKELFWILFGQS